MELTLGSLYAGHDVPGPEGGGQPDFENAHTSW
jgi:hypothetical protein